MTTTFQQPGYIVHAPTAQGGYRRQFGWTVRTPDGRTMWTGDEAGARRAAHAMNRVHLTIAAQVTA